MSEVDVDRISGQILARGEILDSDMLPLRRAIGADFKISEEEADILFALNDLDKKPDDWADYFVLVMQTYLINQQPPLGYVDGDNAGWLLKRINHDGVVETHTELRLLLSLLRVGQNVTERLEKFALDQVMLAVVDGKGFLAKGRELQPGVIGEAEVQILKQVFYGASSEGGVSISRMEAEALFNLNEMCTGAENHESWNRLFVHGIANHLMMLAAWEEPDISEALRREEWLESENTINVRRVVSTVARSANPVGFWANLKAIFGHQPDDNLSGLDFGGMVESEKVTAREAAWLIDRLNRDGGIDDNERALLEFIRRECPEIDESLMPYINAA